MTCPEATRLVPDAPASAHTILCTLADEGRLTMKDLQQSSGLARRTVYAAIRRLQEAGIIQARPSLEDTRQTWYQLA